MRLPITDRPSFNSTVGLMVSMPFLASSSWYHLFFSCDSFQPRSSACAPAFFKASCVAGSSASNAFLFTMMAFLGNQACVS
ncbi:hypothetical protein G6F31_020996 [Rhizopus arrhizus]|nr:hypothetical protein G6F31_020996 [Rhizopus arrhizus]